MSSREDKGAALTEFALLFGLLLMLALGVFEYGMVFRDSQMVSTATREAGRVAASTANYGDADCVILEAAAGALQSLDSSAISEVHIYLSSASGAIPQDNASTMRRYSPYQSDDPSLVACKGSNWNAEHLGPDWEPADRINELGGADWVGVRVQYDHSWLTDFLWFNGTVSLQDSAVFRIEPPAR